MKALSSQVKIALELLRDEARGDILSALKKMNSDYTMTWVYQGKQQLFPSTKPDFSAEMKEAYDFPNRSYAIKNIAEGKNVVMIELIESYRDPKRKKTYRTPLVLVLEMKGRKVRTGRHYTDPALSHLALSSKQIDKAYPRSPTKLTIDANRPGTRREK